MNRRVRFYPIAVIAVMMLGAGLSRAQQQPASTTATGIPDQITKWVTPTALGSSLITETKTGLIGIGTTAPSSKLTVVGVIQSSSGGFKFPDGTLQTTAGLSALFRDATLTGNGTAGSPLGIAAGGVGVLQLANGAVTGQKIANGSVVRSLNGLFDNVVINAGANVTITPSGNGLTIAAPNLLSTVARDATLAGNGTAAFPLGIANGGVTAQKLNTLTAPTEGQFLSFDGNALVWQTPGTLAGVVTDTSLTGDGTAGSPLRLAVPLSLTNPSNGGTAMFTRGGDSNDGLGGVSIQATGGGSSADNGGNAILALGGQGSGQGNIGGAGILAVAGLGVNGAGSGLAGAFLGGVDVFGSFSVSGGGTKNFKIDHPLDPANKYLYHAAIESSEVLNVYSGNVTTDGSGEAAVTLPDWFEAINSDFRYQLTVVGTFAQAIVAEEVKGNRFRVRTSAPNVKVSWQVTGVRSDAAIKKHPFKVVEDKPEHERGHYLAPEAFDQPEEKSVRRARYPEIVKQGKEN